MNQSRAHSSVDGDAVTTGVTKNLASRYVSTDLDGVSTLTTGKSG